jgi:hypothetical protein
MHDRSTEKFSNRKWVEHAFVPGKTTLAACLGLGLWVSGFGACDPKTQQAQSCNVSTDCPGGQLCGPTGQCVPKPKSIVLTITKLGDGQGSVTSSPAGLDCGTTCSGNFDLGTPITLTATPQTGSFADGFSIGCVNTGTTCSFTPTLDEPVQVGVNFSLVPPTQPAPLCNAAGFCWENPRPQGNRLYDVALLPSGEVWAVGEAGTIVRRTGSTNLLLGSGTTQTLFGIATVGTDLVMVGQGGIALRGSSGGVTPEASGIGQDLYAVSATATGAIAVGAAGKIVRRSGFAWNSDTSLTTQTLRAVGSNNGELFAVGDAGTVLANSGTAWRVVNDSLFGVKNLTAVASLSGLAHIGSLTGEVLRQGTPWSRVCCTNLPDIRGMTSGGMGLLAVGMTVGGVVMHSADGSTWTAAIDGAPSAFYGTTASATEAWVVGDAGVMQSSTNGLSWQKVSAGATGTMRAVAGTSTGWFGAGQGGVVLRSVGTTLVSFVAPGLPDFYGVSAVSPTEAYAVGSAGTIYQFNGTTWQKITSGTSSTLRAVWAAGAGDAWAVGDAGTVVHVKNGSASSMSSGTTKNLLSVWGTGASDVWAVGASGTVSRYQGTSFALVTAPATTRDLTSVWGNLPSNVWMVAGPDAFVWNGNNYQKYSPSAFDLSAVGGFSSEVYAVGTKGQLYRYVGTGFSPIETGTRNNLLAVALTASSLFVAGDSGTILSKTR